MPIGLIVRDGHTAFESCGQRRRAAARSRAGDRRSPALHQTRRSIRNVVWITADVHYAAAHYYDPARAQFTDFDPFWEFVAGPLNAGTFGPGVLDNTFGPQVKFISVPTGMKPNRPPSDGLQFFGAVRIDGETETLTVSLHNLAGQKVYSVDLQPANWWSVVGGRWPVAGTVPRAVATGFSP